MMNDLFQTTKVTMSQQHSGLQVFGLQWPMTPMLVYSTMDEAMSAGTLDVTEVSAEGSVPELKVESRSDVMTFLMVGEQVIGAKQNRVLNVSLMIGAHTALSVPVTCVEAGRWKYRSAKFASGGTMSHGVMRKMMSKQVRESYRETGTPSADQGAVWDEVNRKLHALASTSPSQEYDQVYKDYRTRLDDLLRELTPPAGCHGVVFAVGGKIAGADVFDQPATLVKLWPKLVRAYALDVLEAKDPCSSVTAEEAERWVRSAAGAKVEQFSTPGLGQDIRLEAPGLTGAALIVEGQPVHVELFVD
jgi:hypothetical protein